MIKSNDIEDFFPLSPMQQGMLFHTLYAPESGVYLDQMSCLLRGDLDLAALEQAWQQVVDRHQILRTAFVWEGLKEPVQVVHRDVKLRLDFYDWAGLSETEQRQKLESLLQSHKSIGLELTKPPLMKVAVARVGQQEHQLVWSRTHLLLDGWSVPILLKEVFALYEACSAGEEIELPVSRSFRNYIVWLRQQDLSRAESFWKETLKGFSAPTSLGIRRLRSAQAEAEPRHKSEELRLSEEVTSRLVSLGREHQITMNTLVQGAWSILLSRYGGNDDVVYGATVAGRPPSLPGVESMLGLFINTLAVRARVSGEDLILPWLKKFQQWHVELRQYEYSSLIQVQSWSEVPRGTPLFETLLVFESLPVFENVPDPKISIEIANARVLELTNYPLYLVVMPYERLLLRINYDGSAYETESIRRMLGHLERILEGIAQHPERRIKDLSMITEAERRQLIEQWNAPGVQYDCGLNIARLFEAQAKRRPEAIALTFDGRSLTYSELNSRSNRLAHLLISLGAGPDLLVAICLDRSFDLLVSILAVLKAGAAYLPVDPHYPSDRLAFMLDDARPLAVLTHSSLADMFDSVALTPLFIDEAASRLDLLPDLNPENRALPDNLAYVIYTSGSTGKPKGVMVSHQNVARLFDSTRDLFAFDERDVWTLFHSYAFDFSVWEMWGALLFGGRLVIVSHLCARTPEKFYELMIEQEVTVLNQTPSAFKQLMEVDRLARGELKLREVIFGGEALEPGSLKGWMSRQNERAANERLTNMYGITETTVHVTHKRIGEEEIKQERGSMIGKAIEDLRVYILDKEMEPVPVGVAGEIYVGGGGVARGYLGRAELTAERFVPDPYSMRGSERLYKSGDVGRIDEAGEIEYLGRSDEQIKIRGYRIEPGEIAAKLKEAGKVREAAVIMREREGGEKRLVGYVVMEEGAEESEEELRGYVKERMPEYMVPVAIVKLKSMPITENGKLDRRGLPEPEERRREEGEGYEGPRTPVEEELAAIWRDVLAIERVGVHDSFFDLGGHSLLVMQAVARVREALGVNLPLASLFETPTLADLAKIIEELRSEPGRNKPQPAQTIRRRSKSTVEQIEELSRLSEEEAQALVKSESHQPQQPPG